jgi:NAD(P)-dependent dehydrogenase (short-subunit alcohol dehydrogenase family)
MLVHDVAALVTGGGSGLGAATAAALAAQGTQVFAVDLPKVVANAPEAQGVTYVTADVTDAEQVQTAVDQVVRSGAPLRVVVNCAGIGPSARIVGRNGPHDLDLFRKVIDVNLVGTFNVLRLASAAIAATEPDRNGQRGVVINTASVAAFDGQVGQIAYSASKGGVVSMTLPAARDLATSGIRVMTIAPGIVDTPMLATISEDFRARLAESVPFPKRLGTPADYAQLVSDIIAHDYLNGEVIRMDGALRMPPR